MKNCNKKFIDRIQVLDPLTKNCLWPDDLKQEFCSQVPHNAYCLLTQSINLEFSDMLLFIICWFSTYLPFIPVGSREYSTGTVYACQLISIGQNSNTCIVFQRQQIIYYLQSGINTMASLQRNIKNVLIS